MPNGKQMNKGYAQRQRDKQLELEKRRQTKERRKKQPQPALRIGVRKQMDRKAEELAQDLALAEMNAKQYKQAWEAEKAVNKAKGVLIDDLQQYARSEYKRGFTIGGFLTFLFMVGGYLIGRWLGGMF